MLSSRTVLLTAALLAACGPEPTPDPVDDGPTLPDGHFRVVLMADSHIIGPQYEPGSENGDLDNESILLTQERLTAAVAKINAIRPRPDYAFLLGDVLHDAYHSHEAAWYQDNESSWSIAADILANLEVPLVPLWGNHDYKVRCDGSGYEQQLSHGLFEDFFDAPPYQAIQHKGWNFIAANSQLGATWTPFDDLCDTGQASYGLEQLQWIEAELDRGLPTIAMFHYTLALVTQSDETDDAEFPDLPTVLGRHDNLVHTFVGHTHRWIDMGSGRGYPHTIIGATRYDADNFWLLDLNSDDGTYTIVDQDKAIPFTTCADTWIYDDGTPRLDPAAEEDGSCGS